MCGRYGRRADKQRIAEWMQTHNTKVFDDTSLAPSYNVAPGSFQPVVRLNEERERELAAMRWGLAPSRAKGGSWGFAPINAKAETAATSPMFREAFKRRRCLVPADLFYEWQKTGEKTRQPYAIGLREGSIFAFAGLWEARWDAAAGRRLETYAILTTDPNELMEKIHNRMPVIVAPKDYGRWLDADAGPPPIDLLRPYPAEEMKAWRVGRRVGNVRNNSPDLCEESWE